ncbi:hypothetical protein QG37_00036 [Candidozyma auris]|nr:hypothetical protein QG37_00036 [[Candida] auris]
MGHSGSFGASGPARNGIPSHLAKVCLERSHPMVNPYTALGITLIFSDRDGQRCSAPVKAIRKSGEPSAERRRTKWYETRRRFKKKKQFPAKFKSNEIQPRMLTKCQVLLFWSIVRLTTFHSSITSHPHFRSQRQLIHQHEDSGQF